MFGWLVALLPQTALMAVLKGAISTFLGVVGGFLGTNFVKMLFDATDEVVETKLEAEEKKAKETPEKADDRRLAVFRGYFEDYKKYRKSKEG